MGGALIEQAGGLLLVRNQRHGGHHDWTPPGGVIDPGESLVDGLTREVFEETGLEVEDWAGPTYRIDVLAPRPGSVPAWTASRISGAASRGSPTLWRPG